ncbi:MAG: NAD(P)H-dependent oxidoreductase [Neisseria sp.]|nr:NAD(P)H-dependent oxidoreductase [Neisseria sp.]
MKNVLIINGHQPFPTAKGRLTQTLVELAAEAAIAKGHTVQTSSVLQFDTEAEVQKHLWADIIIVQFPIYWMTVPWPLKKYMDEVFSAGSAGIFCNGDGRSSKNPTAGYGSGGLLGGKRYLLSVTFNAPRQAFDNPGEYLFQGRSVDDLLFPVHMSYRSFAMQALPTFACFDVLKNPDLANDFLRFGQHLADCL